MTTKPHRVRFADREAPEVHTTQEIGPQRRLTPEGYLLCMNVPLSRTGDLIYAPSEIPGAGINDQGLVVVARDEAALFDATTISSFQGKPVTLGHPPKNVGAGDWREYSVGTVLNPRRGEGADSDILVGDLLIMDQRCIDAINNNEMRETSAGYDADIQALGPGMARIAAMRGNHVALVARGRCGPRCAVNDHDMVTIPKEPHMATTTHRVRGAIVSTASRVRDAITRGIQDGMEAAMDVLGDHPARAVGDPDGDDGSIHIHVHTGEQAPAPDAAAGATGSMDDVDGDGTPNSADADPTAPNGSDLSSRVMELETAIGTLTALVQQLVAGGSGTPAKVADAALPDDVQEDDTTTPPTEPVATTPAVVEPPVAAAVEGDSRALATSYQTMMSDAEVLVPGYKTPLMDTAMPRNEFVDSMCGTRRRVLEQFAQAQEGQQLLASLHGGAAPDLAVMDCAGVATAFTAAAGAKRLLNNAATLHDAHRAPQQPQVKSYTPLSGDMLAAQLADYWSRQPQPGAPAHH